MSFKAYAMKIENPAQAEILQKYLQEMQGVGYFNHALRFSEKRGDFEVDDIVAVITVDRGDLRESLVDETFVCAHNEVPFFTRLETFILDEDGTISYPIEGMAIDRDIKLDNLGRAVDRMELKPTLTLKPDIIKGE